MVVWCQVDLAWHSLLFSLRLYALLGHFLHVPWWPSIVCVAQSPRSWKSSFTPGVLLKGSHDAHALHPLLSPWSEAHTCTKFVRPWVWNMRFTWNAWHSRLMGEIWPVRYIDTAAHGFFLQLKERAFACHVKTVFRWNLKLGHTYNFLAAIPTLSIGSLNGSQICHLSLSVCLLVVLFIVFCLCVMTSVSTPFLSSPSRAINCFSLRAFVSHVSSLQCLLFNTLLFDHNSPFFLHVVKWNLENDVVEGIWYVLHAYMYCPLSLSVHVTSVPHPLSG